MANNNNIPQFSAVDIEKYHKGLLTPKERHALEKAALDDPFLADALEGYTTSGIDVAADVSELKSRLAKKITTAKIIPLATNRRSSFTLLRAAAVIVFIAGAGLLIYQFGFNKKNNNIAQVNENNATKENIVSADTNITTPTVSSDKNKRTTTPNVATTPVPATPGNDASTSNKEKNIEAVAATEKTAIENAPGATASTPAITQPAKIITKDDAIESKSSSVVKDASDNDLKKINSIEEVKQEKELIAKKQQENASKANRAVTTNRSAEEQYRNQTNIFRGRVTDADNNGVPFANVTNSQDNNAGTYTDAKGYFNLTSPDTLLTVQVRSIGFENNQALLRNSVPNNQVVLQDDRKSLSEIVVSSQKPNAAARSRDLNIKIEEPEPADGWEKYDSYLANNLKAPEDFKPKQSNLNNGVVEVSFEVNKNGEPANFKIEKSLCSSCDKEAIRLIKEGPKWKRKAKKERTTVKVNF